MFNKGLVRIVSQESYSSICIHWVHIHGLTPWCCGVLKITLWFWLLKKTPYLKAAGAEPFNSKHRNRFVQLWIPKVRKWWNNCGELRHIYTKRSTSVWVGETRDSCNTLLCSNQKQWWQMYFSDTVKLAVVKMMWKHGCYGCNALLELFQVLY